MAGRRDRAGKSRIEGRAGGVGRLTDHNEEESLRQQLQQTQEELKQTQEELKQTQEELKQTQEEFKQAQEQLAIASQELDATNLQLTAGGQQLAELRSQLDTERADGTQVETQLSELQQNPAPAHDLSGKAGEVVNFFRTLLPKDTKLPKNTMSKLREILEATED